MGRRIRITAGPVSIEAELNNTTTADVIWQALPINGTANTWGEEIYFAISVQHDLENGQEVVEAGDIGYWPPGNAFCIFFGPTPASHGDEIRAASPVNVFGRVIGNPKVLTSVKDVEKICVERSEME